MTVIKEKFKVGDIVTWRNDPSLPKLGSNAHYGEGPFEIKRVLDVPYEPGNPDACGSTSNWVAMGHTQLVDIEDSGSAMPAFSGVWFVKI